MLIVLDNKNRYLQRKNRFDSLDIETIAVNIKREIKFTNFFELSNNLVKIHDVILFTSSQIELYKNYIDDVMYNYKDKLLIPSYDVLISHENKLSQEFYNRKYNIDTGIKTFLIGDIEDLINLNENGLLPKKYVLKASSGSASTNVKICESLEEGISAITNMYKFILEGYNKSTPAKYDQYPEENKTKCKVIVQEFIHSSKREWRLLFSGDKIFGYMRKKNDENSLASGKLHEMGYDGEIEIPLEILKYGEDIFSKIQSPFAILDIMEDEINDRLCLLEWSGIHIGILFQRGVYTRYYLNEKGKYISYRFNDEISDTFADAINLYLEENEN